MKKSLTVFTTVLILILVHVSYSATPDFGRRLKGRSIRENSRLSQKTHRVGSQSDTWNIYDWCWLIDGSMANIEALLTVNFEEYLSIFYDYDFVTSIFSGYALKNAAKWDNCSNFKVAMSGYNFNSTFDSKGNVTGYNISDNCKYKMTNNSNNLPTEWAVEEWDAADGVWWPYKYNFLYGTNNKLKEFGIIFEENDVWYNWEKFDLTYTTDDKLKSEIYYKWNFTTQVWDKKTKWEYDYTGDGKISEDITYYWDTVSGDWATHTSRTAYTFNSNGKLKDCIEYIWDEISGEWKIKDYKTSFTYDNNGNITEDILYKWDTGSETWKEYGDKYTYTYNSDGNFLEELHSVWDNTSGTWEPGEYKFTYNYNGSGDLTENIDLVWESASNEWVNDYKYEFKYDNDGMPDKCLMYSYNSTWVSDGELDISFNDIIPIIFNNSQDLKGKNIVTSRVNSSEIKFFVKGKPVKNEKMQIFDLQGRLIQELKPRYEKNSALYAWNYTTGTGKSAGNKLFIYIIEKGDVAFSGKISSVNIGY